MVLEYTVYTLILFWHLIADQHPDDVSKAKAYSIRALLDHIGSYTLKFTPVAIFLLWGVLGWSGWQTTIMIGVNLVGHLFVDSFVYSINRELWEKDVRQPYYFLVVCLDEFLHLGLMIWTLYHIHRVVC